jgi:hypothetical protein
VGGKKDGSDGIERPARRLAGLRHELRRVNRTLARMARSGGAPAPARPAPISAASVRAILAARRLRADMFGSEVGGPAWALLLEAFAARLEDRETPMTGLGAVSGIARSTAHRWVGWLLDRGLLVRHAHPADERIALISLDEAAAERIRAYLTAAARLSR